MSDESSRKPKIKLAAEDGAGTAQQQPDLPNPKPELSGESAESHAIPRQIDLAEPAMSITKPTTFALDKFKSKRAAAVADVETLQTGLPHHNIAQARDFVRLHPNEDYSLVAESSAS